MTNLQTQNIKINSETNEIEKSQSSAIQDTCICKNKKPQLVTTIQESEIVCKNCGVVFGFDEDDNRNNTIPHQHITKSKINLYQKRQKGGNPHDVKKIIHIPNLRLENNNSNIISFADICDKLKLSDVTSENCWKSYCDLKKQTGRFTRAKAMCLAIYQTCRFHHIPFGESNIQDIVCQSLGVKNSPMLKNIIFKIHSNKKSSFSQNSSEKERFYLNLHLSQAQKDHNIDDITILRRIAARYCETLICPRLNNNDSSPFMKNADYNVLTKRAVKLAIQRCIIQ